MPNFVNMFDLQQMCRQHGVTPRGVVHVGAHEGQELAQYAAMGVHRVLFIEANPAVYQRLTAKIAGSTNVMAVRCAVSDTDGTATLHVTSMDQSSSILPLKRHAAIYPSIVETHQVTVVSRKLDTLLPELKLQPADFNVVNIDIQGAELMAFKGAIELLTHIDIIFTEVNFEELYAGCPLIAQLDEFLAERGFTRVAVTTPYHPSWGDATYVKSAKVALSA
jgi:FkbM family methyltransferase